MDSWIKGLATACGITVLLCGIDLLAGGGGIGIPEGGIFMKLRLPRMLSAALAGASLALAGLQMQSLFRNPLADPHIMGVSAGAGTGAAVATLLIGASLPAALSGLTVAGAAFAGALLTSALVTVVASRLHDAPTLLVFGVMLGFVFSAVTAILEYSANAESLKVFYSWSAGSFSGNTLPQAGIMAVAAAVGLALAAMNSSGLDAALFGDDYSAMTGVPIRRVRIVSVIGSYGDCILRTARIRRHRRPPYSPAPCRDIRPLEGNPSHDGLRGIDRPCGRHHFPGVPHPAPGRKHHGFDRDTRNTCDIA